MNKTPFEVRLDVMKMAQEMLDKEQSIKMEKYNAKIRALQQDKMPGDMIIKYIDDEVPAMYSSNDILNKANELYDFVNNSTASSASFTRSTSSKTRDVK